MDGRVLRAPGSQVIESPGWCWLQQCVPTARPQLFKLIARGGRNFARPHDVVPDGVACQGVAWAFEGANWARDCDALDDAVVAAGVTGSDAVSAAQLLRLA